MSLLNLCPSVGIMGSLAGECGDGQGSINEGRVQREEWGGGGGG